MVSGWSYGGLEVFQGSVTSAGISCVCSKHKRHIDYRQSCASRGIGAGLLVASMLSMTDAACVGIVGEHSNAEELAELMSLMAGQGSRACTTFVSKSSAPASLCVFARANGQVYNQERNMC